MTIRKMIEERKPPEFIIKKYGFEKMESAGKIEKIIKDVISKNRQAVDDYAAGEEKSLHFLIGQVMRESKGTIDPNKARELLEKELK